jgi:carbon-monoxide dehydrogenase large subunit
MNPDDRGRSVRRHEDARFLTGRGRYVADVTLPGEVHAYVVRSPHGHALIQHIETGAARQARGVFGVFTESDLRADGVGTLPCVAQVNTLDPLIVPPRYALARGRVRHVGDPVALVVAETRDLARDAAALIAVAYRPLDVVADASAALAPGAPLV